MTKKALLVASYVWFALLVGIQVLVVVATLYTAPTFGDGLNTVTSWYSPTNVATFLVNGVLAIPGIVAYYFATRNH